MSCVAFFPSRDPPPLTVFKNHKKVSFIIASEASYVYILSRKKFIKNTKNGQFGMFWQTEATILTVLPDKPTLIEQKLIESAKIRNSNEAFFGDF